MSPVPRRALTVDDPVGGREACHVARPPAPGETEGRLRQIPIEDIHPSAGQPRKHFDDAALNLLAGSIRERGVLQPIIVRPGMSVGFEIVAGERRWRAARLAGLSTIPALIDRSLDGADSLELALIENVAREDLTVIEEARTIALLLDDLHVTRTLLACRLGRSRSDIAHTVRLLELPAQAIELIDTGTLTKGHGKVLLTEPDHHRRRVLALRAVDAGWSVRPLEDEISRRARPRKPRSEPHPSASAGSSRMHARPRSCKHTRRNRVWQADFSELETAAGGTWQMSGVVDYVAKLALCCPVTTTKTWRDAVAALEDACSAVEDLLGVSLLDDCTCSATGEITPVIVVSDNGPCYRATGFARYIAGRPALQHVRTRHRSPGTNGVIERFYQSLKYEHLYRHEIDDGPALADHVDGYLYTYNHQRPHEALKIALPIDRYAAATTRDNTAETTPSIDESVSTT